MEEVLDTLIGVTLTIFIWLFLRFVSGRRGTVDAAGNLVMRHSEPMRWFIALAALVFGIVIPWHELHADLAVSETLAFAGMGLLACVALLYFNLLRIVVSREGIHRLAPWRCNIPWPEIARIEADLPEKHFLITTQSGKRLRIHFALTGMADFIDRVKANRPPEVYEQARAGFDLFPPHRSIGEAKVSP